MTISNALTLEEVCSLNRLKRIGKRLKLCVAYDRTARRYIERKHTNEKEMWTLIRNRKDIGLMEIDVDNDPRQRVVDLCETTGNEDVVLPFDEALEIVTKLDISHCNCPTFKKIRAFPLFANINVRDSAPNPIRVGHKWHKVWRTPSETIIASTNEIRDDSADFLPEQWKWSRFSLDDKKWDGEWDNHLEEGHLLKLSLESKALQTALLIVRFKDATD